MKARYIKGLSYKHKGQDRTYEIDDRGTDNEPSHGGKIIVYGDIKLRDKIIKLLNKEERK